MSGRGRLESIDWLRGVVMVLMALDHVRDFFSEYQGDPLDLKRTTVPLFFTRWVTHFCAPVFVFHAGTGAYLAGARGTSKPRLAWFLLTRGLWLVLLEFTLVHLGWFFNFRYAFVTGQVIWAIGVSMMLLAGLVCLPTALTALLGVVLIAGHNLFDGLNVNELGELRVPWMVMMSGGLIPGRVTFIAAYPILPWLGIMAAGYAFGAIYTLDDVYRRRCLFALGAGLTLQFVVLRASNIYGDPRP